MSPSEFASPELIPLIACNPGVAGAPTLHLNMLYNRVTGNINAEAVITQAVAVPYARIVVPKVHGKAHALGWGPGGNVLVVSLHGEYEQEFTPPAIGVRLCKFEALLLVDAKWSGRTSYSYDHHKVADEQVALAR